MKKSVAIDIQRIFLDISRMIDDSIRLVMENDSEEEFIKFRTISGKIMGEIYFEILDPIKKQYQELDPTKL